jgi:hypothetical protein
MSKKIPPSLRLRNKYLSHSLFEWIAQEENSIFLFAERVFAAATAAALSPWRVLCYRGEMMNEFRKAFCSITKMKEEKDLWRLNFWCEREKVEAGDWLWSNVVCAIES